MIIYKDIVSGVEVSSDAYEINITNESKDPKNPKYQIQRDLNDFLLEKGKYKNVIHAFESTKVTVGGDIEVDTGANASAEPEEAEEKLEASEKKQVLDIVHNQHLVKVNIDKPSDKVISALKSATKDEELIKTFSGSSFAKDNLNKYWVALKNALQEQKMKFLLEVDSTYTVNKDRSKVKDEETKLAQKLKKDEKMEFEEARARYEKFEKDYKTINLFYAQYVLPNFSEFDFYTPEDATVGECLLIPARYIGESTTPYFYFIAAALLDEKQ